MLRPIHFSLLPCSDLGQGVAISTTAFILPRFFVQTPIFSVFPSSFRTVTSISPLSFVLHRGIFFEYKPSFSHHHHHQQQAPHFNLPVT